MPLKLDDAQLKCGPDTTGFPIRFEHVGAATVRNLQSLKQPILGFPDRMEIALMNDPTPVINQVRDPRIDVIRIHDSLHVPLWLWWKGHPIRCPSNIPYYCNAMPHPVNGSPLRY